MLYDDTLLLRFDTTTTSAFGYFRCPICTTETYEGPLRHRPACQHAGPLEFWLGKKAIARILAGSDHINPVSEGHLRSQLPEQVAASDLVRRLPPVAGETPTATQALPTLMTKAASHTSVAAASHLQKGPFVTRYGYRKVFVPAGLGGETEVVGYGVRSDREEQREPLEIRQMGEAPGVLPLFILEHLLPVALIMHKEDLEGELPPCREVQVPIEIAEDDQIGQEMLAEHQRRAGCLMQKIRADLYSSYAGKLWGAMSLSPSYLDRATYDLTPFVLKYPEEVGGAVVAEGKLFPASELTPKERWLLARVCGYLDEGRNVLIFLLHTGKSASPLDNPSAWVMIG